jgi:AraC family transcriptional regulator
LVYNDRRIEVKTFLVSTVLLCTAFAVYAGGVPELDVVAKDIPTYNLAYVRTVGAYDSPDVIGAAFEEVCTWAEEKGLVGDGTVLIGVNLDDPGLVPVAECRYDASVTVPDGTEGEGDVGVRELPAGRYAVYTAGGSYENIGEELEKIYGDLMSWWPTCDYEMDDRPWLEIYKMTKEKPEAKKFVVDICVPITGD